MSEEPRELYWGTPMSEWMEQAANELADDAVGLWGIVSDGRTGFGLEGEALTDYVRRQIAVLLARGGVPVVGGGETEHFWIVERQYGSRPDEIVENVMREWLANGAGDEDPGGLWFTLPENAWTPPD